MTKLTWYEAILVVLFSVVAGGMIERHAWWHVGACFVMIASILFVGRQSLTPHVQEAEQ